MKNTLKLTVFLSLALTACTGHKVQQAISDSNASAQASREDGGKKEDPAEKSLSLPADASEFGVDESRKDIQVGTYRFRLKSYLCNGTTGEALDLWVRDLSQLPGVSIRSLCTNSDPTLDIVVLTPQYSTTGLIATQTRQTWNQCDLYTRNMNNDFTSDNPNVRIPYLSCIRSQVNPEYAFVKFEFLLPNSNYIAPNETRITSLTISKDQYGRPWIEAFGFFGNDARSRVSSACQGTTQGPIDHSNGGFLSSTQANFMLPAIDGSAETMGGTARNPITGVGPGRSGFCSFTVR